MAFEFWLIDEKNKIKLLLPVTPAMYDIEYGNEIEVIGATAKGNIHIAGHKRLHDIRIEGFFTTKDYCFVNKTTYQVSEVMDYVRLIKRWINEKLIIRMVIASDVTKLNARFYVENIKYSENNESNGDINYVIDLKEYRSMNTPTEKAVNVVENKARASNAPPKKSKSYKVQKGDNLIKISRKVYGDGTQWRKIYNANKGVIGNNSNLIYPGQVYVIP